MKMTILVSMKTTSLTRLKEALGSFIDHVKGGNRVVITEHDNPVAIISPFSDFADSGIYNLQHLIRQGIISPPSNLTKRKKLLSPLSLGDQQDRILGNLLTQRKEGW